MYSKKYNDEVRFNMTIMERINTTETVANKSDAIPVLKRQKLTRKRLKEFTEYTGKPIISIYMDTYRFGEEQLLNGRQLGRIIPHIEKELISKGLSLEEISEYIQPLKNLAENENEWQHMDEGIAIFISEQLAISYTLHNDVDFSWTVDEKPRLEPLIKELGIDKDFLILSVSQDDVRLLEADEQGFKKLGLAEIPGRMKDVVAENDLEKTKPSRIDNGAGFAVSFGHDKNEIQDQQIYKFLKTIADNLKTALPVNDNRPIVVLCPPSYMSVFREHSALQHTRIAFVHGAWSRAAEHELYESALPIFNEELDNTETIIEEIIDKGESQKLIERSTSAIHELSTETGRIDTLIIKPIKSNGSPKNKDDITIVDEILINTVEGNGRIISYELDDVFPMTATLRY